MTRLPLAAGFVAVAALTTTADEPKPDLKKLNGTWYSVSTEADGNPKAGEDRKDLHHLADGVWDHEVGGKVVMRGKYRAAEGGGKRAAIDFEVTEGWRKGEVWQGIAKIDGDTLTWCGGFAKSIKARPTEFVTRSGDGLLLRVMRRPADK